MSSFSQAKFFAFRFFTGCPVGCHHCSANAPTRHPTRNETTIEDVLAVADFYVRMGGSKHAFFMGHELDIGNDEFNVLAAELILGRGFTLSAATSGYWAKTSQSMLAGINYLRNCGIVHLQLSVDYFHKNILNDQDVIKLITKCHQAGISVTLHEVLMPHVTPRSSRLSMHLEGIELHQSPISFIGRASSLNVNNASSTCGACDFGELLYLETDNCIYACSGPGNKVRSRSLGYVSSGTVTYHTPCDHLAKIVRAVNNNCDSCYDHFRRREPKIATNPL